MADPRTDFSSAPRPRRQPAHRAENALRRAIEPLEARTLLSVSLVKDINVAIGGVTLVPSAMVGVGQTMFLAVGSALWKSDGTGAGTALVADNLNPSELSNAGGVLYFSSGSK